MRRRLFTALSMLSLVLCVAAAALWVWSYHSGWLLYLSRPQTEIQAGASRGSQFVYLVTEPPARAGCGRCWRFESYNSAPNPKSWGTARAKSRTRSTLAGSRWVRVRMPPFQAGWRTSSLSPAGGRRSLRWFCHFVGSIGSDETDIAG